MQPTHSVDRASTARNMSIHPDLLEKILNFRDERNWAQFHNPKDLAAGLVIEAAELQEILLWKKPEELAETIALKKNELAAELAAVCN
jgi:NTP pyrophosphatase (non-canonical NTP hydrolase)